MRTSSDIDDAGRSGAGDWSQPSSMDLALHAGQMPADAGSAVDEEQKGAIYRTIRQPTLHCTGRQLETWEEIEKTRRKRLAVLGRLLRCGQRAAFTRLRGSHARAPARERLGHGFAATADG